MYRGLTWKIVLESVLWHALIVTLIFAVARFWQPYPVARQKVIWTQLVQKGALRPKDLLPRKPEEAAPTAADVPLPPQRNPEPQNAAQVKAIAPKKKIAHSAKRSPNLSKALARLKHEVIGDPNGADDGDTTQLRILGDVYMRTVVACLQEHYVIEGLAREKVIGRSAGVLMHIGRDGIVLAAKISEPSGLPAFDQAVLQAVKGCHQLSPPPLRLQRQVTEDGIEVTFTLGNQQ